MAGKYTVIKRFADNYYSVTQIYNKYTTDDVSIPIPKIKGERGHDSKLRESLIRSRTKIFELAMCNEWELFCTFTIDPEKYDRYNLKTYYNDFGEYISNFNRNHNCSIKYMLIPEMHKDGAWHMHGFIMGLPRYYLRRFSLKEKLPKYIRKKLKEGQNVYDWVSYRIRFGFCDFEYIRNREAASKYITKYITKDLAKSVQGLNAKVYYCSKNLNRPEIVYKGMYDNIIALPDFSNIFMARKDFFDLAEAYQCHELKFTDSFLETGLDEEQIIEMWGK